VCIHYSKENSKQQRKDHKQSVSFSFFFAEAERRIFLSQRERERKEADDQIFADEGKISYFSSS
jgi:hypothetical protein